MTNNHITITLQKNELSALTKGLLNFIRVYSSDDKVKDDWFEEEFNTLIGMSRQESNELIDKVISHLKKPNDTESVE